MKDYDQKEENEHASYAQENAFEDGYHRGHSDRQEEIDDLKEALNVNSKMFQSAVIKEYNKAIEDVLRLFEPMFELNPRETKNLVPII